MKRLARVLFFLLLLPPLYCAASESSSDQAQQEKGRPARQKFPKPSGPSQYVLISAKVRQGASAEAEKAFRDEILPAVAASPSVLDVKSFVNVIGCDFTYLILVEVRAGVPIGSDSALELFSGHRPLDQTLAALEHFLSYFESKSVSLVLYRSDLSMSRGAIATAAAYAK